MVENILRGGDGGGAIGTSGQVVQAPTVTAPTTAEVSQSAAADAAEDNILLRKRRAKASWQINNNSNRFNRCNW
jgi:hypothetical protein